MISTLVKTGQDFSLTFGWNLSFKKMTRKEPIEGKNKETNQARTARLEASHERSMQLTWSEKSLKQIWNRNMFYKEMLHTVFKQWLSFQRACCVHNEKKKAAVSPKFRAKRASPQPLKWAPENEHVSPANVATLQPLENWNDFKKIWSKWKRCIVQSNKPLWTTVCKSLSCSERPLTVPKRSRHIDWWPSLRISTSLNTSFVSQATSHSSKAKQSKLKTWKRLSAQLCLKTTPRACRVSNGLLVAVNPASHIRRLPHCDDLRRGKQRVDWVVQKLKKPRPSDLCFAVPNEDD